MAINFNQLRILSGHFAETAGSPGQMELNPAIAGSGMSMAAGLSLGINISATRPSLAFSAGGGAWSFPADELQLVGSPTLSASLANKGYVDNAIAGLTWKRPVLTPEVLIANGKAQVISLNVNALVNGDTIVIGALGTFTYQVTPAVATDFNSLATLKAAIDTAGVAAPDSWTATQVTGPLSSISADLIVVVTNSLAPGVMSGTATGLSIFDFSTSSNYDKIAADLIQVSASPALNGFGESMGIPTPGQARLIMSTDNQYVYDLDAAIWVQFSTGALSAGQGISIVSGVVSVPNLGIKAGMIDAGVVSSAELATGAVTSIKIFANAVTPAKLSFGWKLETFLGSTGTVVGTGTDFTVPVAVNADVTLAPSFILSRNGIDDMSYVSATPAVSGEWTIVGNTITVFGDVTAAGDLFRARYMI